MSHVPELEMSLIFGSVLKGNKRAEETGHSKVTTETEVGTMQSQGKEGQLSLEAGRGKAKTLPESLRREHSPAKHLDSVPHADPAQGERKFL